MGSEFCGTLYDGANIRVATYVCVYDICTSNYNTSKNTWTNTYVKKRWGSSRKTAAEEWNVERRKDVREMRMKRRKETKLQEERSSEFTHARRRLYVAGKHKTSDGYILNFFIIGSCTRQIISGVVYAGIWVRTFIKFKYVFMLELSSNKSCARKKNYFLFIQQS